MNKELKEARNYTKEANRNSASENIIIIIIKNSRGVGGVNADLSRQKKELVKLKTEQLNLSSLWSGKKKKMKKSKQT